MGKQNTTWGSRSWSSPCRNTPQPMLQTQASTTSLSTVHSRIYCVSFGPSSTIPLSGAGTTVRNGRQTKSRAEHPSHNERPVKLSGIEITRPEQCAIYWPTIHATAVPIDIIILRMKQVRWDGRTMNILSGGSQLQCILPGQLGRCRSGLHITVLRVST